MIYDPNALARDHVNNFWDTSTPICQTESLTGIYTGPDAGRVNTKYTCGLLRPKVHLTILIHTRKVYKNVNNKESHTKV